MADRQKQQVREAIRKIKTGLEYQLNQSDKLGDKAFTARSRDFGITDPDIQKEITKRQVANLRDPIWRSNCRNWCIRIAAMIDWAH